MSKNVSKKSKMKKRAIVKRPRERRVIRRPPRSTDRERPCRYCGELVLQSQSTWVPTVDYLLDEWIKILGDNFKANLKHTKSNVICMTHIVDGKRGITRLPMRMDPDPGYIFTPYKAAKPRNPLVNNVTRCRLCQASKQPKELIFLPSEETKQEKWFRRLGPWFKNHSRKYVTNRICRSHMIGQGKYIKPYWVFRPLPKEFKNYVVEEVSDDEEMYDEDAEEIQKMAMANQQIGLNKGKSGKKMKSIPIKKVAKPKTRESDTAEAEKPVPSDIAKCRLCDASVHGNELYSLPLDPINQAIWFRLLGPEFRRTVRNFVSNRICISHKKSPDSKPTWVYRPLTEKDARREKEGRLFVGEESDEEEVDGQEREEVDNGDSDSDFVSINSKARRVKKNVKPKTRKSKTVKSASDEEEVDDEDSDSDFVAINSKAGRVKKLVKPKTRKSKAGKSAPSTSRASSNSKSSKIRKSEDVPSTSRSSRSRAVAVEAENGSSSSNSQMVEPEDAEPVATSSRILRSRRKDVEPAEEQMEEEPIGIPEVEDEEAEAQPDAVFADAFELEPIMEEQPDEFAEVAEMDPFIADQPMDEAEMDQPGVEDPTLAEQPMEDEEMVENQMEIPAIDEPVEDELGIQGDLEDLRNPEQVQMVPMVEAKEEKEDDEVEVKPVALVVVKQEAAIEESNGNGNEAEANSNNGIVEAAMETDAEIANAPEEVGEQDEQIAKFPCRRCERMFPRNALMEIKDISGVFDTWRPILGDQFVKNILTMSAPHFICDEDQDILEAALDQKVPQ